MRSGEGCDELGGVGTDDPKAELVNDDQAALECRGWPRREQAPQGYVHCSFPVARPMHDDDAMVGREGVADEIGEVVIRRQEHGLVTNCHSEDGLVACAVQAQLLEGGYAVAERAQNDNRGAANALIGEKVGQSVRLLSDALLRV